MFSVAARVIGRSLILACALLTVGFAVQASVVDEDVVPFSNRFPVEITLSNPSDVRQLAQLGIDIDAVGEGWMRAYLSPSEVQAVGLLGFPVERIPNQALRMWRSLREREAKGDRDEYHNYTELTAYLQGIASDHSSITRLVSAGQSVQGRELWVLQISDNPDVEENEPEFLYVSTMHGDEPVGTENCLQFIDMLTDNYDSAMPDPDLERLVNEIDIWIMPMMNPDGNTAGSRYNAHGVDLNRDFPDWVTDPNNTPVGREDETAVMMAFTDGKSFDLSANFHTGALVVNYPYDNRYTLCPDNDLFITMSESYSIHNTPMWNSPTFYHGITNGAQWYVVYGGMQDWNMDWMYNKHVTIELNNVKWPPESQLPQLWDDNDESMVAYMEWCLCGVRGVVTDASNGDPVPAFVEIEGNGWIDRTDPDAGDYHRILEPGTYTLTFSSPGYLDQTISDVVVSAGDATVLNVQLGTTATVSVSGTVTSTAKAPLEATVEARYHQTGNLAASTTSDPVDGSYSLSLSPSEYDFTAWATGYAAEHEFATIQADTSIDFVLEPVTGSILVIDDDSGKRLLEKRDAVEIEYIAEPRERTSASDIAADLLVLGYEVTEETSTGTDPAAWSEFYIVVWSSGSNTSPVGSSTRRGNLIAYTAAGGKLLIEGGELTYDAIGYPGYPNFADSVLHADDWGGDQVGNLVQVQAGHAISTDPNPLPLTMGISYSGWGSEDAANPTDDAYIVYGTSSQPTDAGILVYDDPPGTGRIVFLPFAYPALSDRSDARNLLQNIVTYLIEDVTDVEDEPAIRFASRTLGVFPNPFNPATTVSFSIPSKQHVRLGVYDVQGRRVRLLVDEILTEGPHRIPWDARDESGVEVGSGMYFCRLMSEGITQVKKMVKLN